jgi:hypothetical protein
MTLTVAGQFHSFDNVAKIAGNLADVRDLLWPTSRKP